MHYSRSMGYYFIGSLTPLASNCMEWAKYEYNGAYGTSHWPSGTHPLHVCSYQATMCLYDAVNISQAFHGTICSHHRMQCWSRPCMQCWKLLEALGLTFQGTMATVCTTYFNIKTLWNWVAEFIYMCHIIVRKNRKYFRKEDIINSYLRSEA
jgi:hypothetical protein